MADKTPEATRKSEWLAAIARMLSKFSADALNGTYCGFNGGDYLEAAFGFDWCDREKDVLANLKAGDAPFFGVDLTPINDQLDEASEGDDDEIVLLSADTNAAELYQFAVERLGLEVNVDPVAGVIDLIETHVELNRLLLRDAAETEEADDDD